MLHFLNENKKYIKYENKYEKCNYIIITALDFQSNIYWFSIYVSIKCYTHGKLKINTNLS